MRLNFAAPHSPEAQRSPDADGLSVPDRTADITARDLVLFAVAAIGITLLFVFGVGMLLVVAWAGFRFIAG